MRAIILLATLTACYTPKAVVTLAPNLETTSELVVLPVTLNYQGAYRESALRTYDVLDTLWQQSKWQVTFQKRAAPGQHMLRTTLIQHDAKFDSQTDAMIKPPAIEAQIAILDGDSRLLARSDFTVVMEQPAPDANLPHPAGRVAIATAIASLIAECQDCVAPGVRTAGVWVQSPAWSPEPQDAILRMGQLDRENRMWGGFRYVNGHVSLDEAARIEKLGPSVCVADVRLPKPWRAGDCVTHIDGKPVFSIHDLVRAAKNTSKVTVSRKNGHTLTAKVDLRNEFIGVEFPKSQTLRPKARRRVK